MKPMAVDPAALKEAIRNELAVVSDHRVRDHIERLLVEPKPVMRAWAFGEPGEQCLCWTVLEDPDGLAVAFCERDVRWPWGLLFVDGGMGDDSHWYGKFLQAVREAILEDLPIWRVFKTVGKVREPISPEGEWSETWRQVMALRERDPTASYECGIDALTSC
jgi:hypothetical protein